MKCSLFSAALSFAAPIGLGLAIAGPALAQPMAGGHVVADTGVTHVVLDSGTPTYLGFISGFLPSAARPQRWSAAPFSLSATTTIRMITADFFIDNTAAAAQVNYIIWLMPPGGRDVQPVAIVPGPAPHVDSHGRPFTGVLGPQDLGNGTTASAGVGNGIADPRLGTDTRAWFHRYALAEPVTLPAGTYYLTIYGDGVGAGNSTGDTWIAWLTGGDLQSPDMERAYMWRSETQPVPGFVQYAPATITPNAGQDPNDIWNETFQLIDNPWDVDGSGVTDDSDLGVVLFLQGVCADDTANFNPAADINADGCIDDSDLGQVLFHQGE